MKNSFLTYFGVLALFFVLMSAVTPSIVRYNTSSEKAQVFTWAVDTITNAGNDTLTISGLQTSNLYGELQIDGKQLSGTQAIVAIVQGSAFPSPDSDQWDEITRDTVNGSLEQVTIDLGQMGRVNYRVVLDGYGTQSSEYEAALNLKKD